MVIKEKRAVILSNRKKNNVKRKYGNSRYSQCIRLLKELQEKKQISTFIGRDLGFSHVAGRIFELRQAGHKIALNWVYEVDGNGVQHRIGQYIYLGKQEQKNV